MRVPDVRSPAGQGGAQEHAAATEYPCGLDSLCASRAQFLMTAHHVRPELAGALATLAFGGGAQ